jgi:hypothetical protein
MSLTRAQSTLPADLEKLAEATIGVCLTVHRELGPGMNESVYARACRLELEASGQEADRRGEVGGSNSPSARSSGRELLAGYQPSDCPGREFQYPRPQAWDPSRRALRILLKDPFVFFVSS